MSIKPITKPDGFFKQRLDNFVKGVTENKKDAQNKKLQEELQKFVASAQGYLQQNDVPDFPEQMPMGNLMTAQVRGQIPWQAPYGYPGLQNPKVSNPELFVTAAEKYKTNSLQNIGQTLVDTFVAPAYYQYMSAQEKAAKEAKDKEEAAATQQEEAAPNDWSIGVSSPEYIPDGTNQTSGVIKQKGGKTGLHRFQTDGQTWQSQLIAGLPQESQNQIMQQANVSDISELTNEQMNAILPELYNAYYSQVGEAFKNNQVPSFGGQPDLSFISNYPIMQGLKMPGTDLRGPGASPQMFEGTNYAPFTTTQMTAPEMGLSDYMGLRQGKRFDLDEDSVSYSPGFSQKLQEALDSGDYDRIQKSVTANPTVAGKLLDKIGIGKMFDTRNYDMSMTVLPEGQSIFDNYDWEDAANRKVYEQNAKTPGGGLMQTDQISPDLWQNISRGERRDLLNEAGIDPNRKNLRGMGRKFLKNEAAMIESERPIDRRGMNNVQEPGSGSGMITIPGSSMQIDVNSLSNGTSSVTKLPSASAPTGNNPAVVPASPQSGPNGAVVSPAATATQPNVVTPNPTTSQTPAYTPPAFDLSRTQNQIVKTEDEWFGTKPAGLALPNNYDPNWKNYAVDKSIGQAVYPNANKVKQDWDSVMTNNPKKKALWESFNDMPAPIREIAADQVFNAGYDPRVMVLGAAGVDKGYTGKGSAVTSNPEYRSWLKTNADQLWKDNKNLINQQYADDPQAFTSSITDNRKIIYGNLRTKDLAGGVRTDFPSNSGGPGTQYNAWSGRSGAVQDYVDKTYFDPSTGYTAPQYFKQRGGQGLPPFQYDGPFQPGKATDKKSFFDFIGAKTDNPFMVGSGDDVLNANGTNKESSYPMGQREVEKSVTATGSGKVKNPFNAIPILNVANSAVANIVTPFFNRKERRDADLAMRNAFMPENTESASPDVRDADRLGYNTFTGAPEGGGLAGSPVQFSSGPLRAFAQRGMQMPRLQVGGSIYLTQDMIDDIISNGGEIEYED